jgi:hypothetical protein
MYKNKQGGLIKTIILVIIAIAILSYYGVDIKNFFTSPQAQKNFSYVWNFIVDIWTNYLATPAQNIWQFWIEHVWGPLMSLLKIGNQTNTTV